MTSDGYLDQLNCSHWTRHCENTSDATSANQHHMWHRRTQVVWTCTTANGSPWLWLSRILGIRPISHKLISPSAWTNLSAPYPGYYLMLTTHASKIVCFCSCFCLSVEYQMSTLIPFLYGRPYTLSCDHVFTDLFFRRLSGRGWGAALYPKVVTPPIHHTRLNVLNLYKITLQMHP